MAGLDIEALRKETITVNGKTVPKYKIIEGKNGTYTVAEYDTYTSFERDRTNEKKIERYVKTETRYNKAGDVLKQSNYGIVESTGARGSTIGSPFLYSTTQLRQKDNSYETKYFNERRFSGVKKQYDTVTERGTLAITKAQKGGTESGAFQSNVEYNPATGTYMPTARTSYYKDTTHQGPVEGLTGGMTVGRGTISVEAPKTGQARDVPTKRATAQPIPIETYTMTVSAEKKPMSYYEGTYTAAPEPQGFFDKVQIFTNKMRYDASIGEYTWGSNIKAATGGAVASLAGTGRFFYDTGKSIATKGVVRTTVETSVGIFNFGKRALTKGLPEVGKTIKNEPAYTFGYASSELAQAWTGGQAVKYSKLGYEKLSTRLAADYMPMTEGSFKFGDTVIDTAKSWTDVRTPIKAQAEKAGKSVTAVSAQRGLMGTFEKEKIVNKPLPTPDSPPLERSFFADPDSTLRTSRLGLEQQKSASFADILSGNVQTTRPKPQVFVFEDAYIAEFPSSLSDVGAKLKSGKTLTAKEARRLQSWQLKPTGEFKPVGFLSTEPEITLAPGEVILRNQRKGVTLINGRKVTFYDAEVKPPASGVDNLKATKWDGTMLNKGSSGKASASSRPAALKPYLDVGSVSVSATTLVNPSFRPFAPAVSASLSPPKTTSIGSTSPVKAPIITSSTVTIPRTSTPTIPSGALGSIPSGGSGGSTPRSFTPPTYSPPTTTPPVSPPYSPPSNPPYTPPPSRPPTARLPTRTPPYTPPSMRSPYSPPKLPKPGEFGPITSKKKKKDRFKMPRRYTPTLHAVVTQTKGYTPKLGKSTLSGLEQRPI